MEYFVYMFIVQLNRMLEDTINKVDDFAEFFRDE